MDSISLKQLNNYKLNKLYQGSHSFTDKKSWTYPGLSRTHMKNFPGPFCRPQMFEYNKKTKYLSERSDRKNFLTVARSI